MGMSRGRRVGDLPYRVSRGPRKRGDPLAASVGDAPINKKKREGTCPAGLSCSLAQNRPASVADRATTATSSSPSSSAVAGWLARVTSGCQPEAGAIRLPRLSHHRVPRASGASDWDFRGWPDVNDRTGSRRRRRDGGGTRSAKTEGSRDTGLPSEVASTRRRRFVCYADDALRRRRSDAADVDVDVVVIVVVVKATARASDLFSPVAFSPFLCRARARGHRFLESRPE